MKVKEVISELQKLDQERNIWISYDGVNDNEYGFTNGIVDPIPDDIVKQPLADDCKKYQERDGLGLVCRYPYILCRLF